MISLKEMRERSMVFAHEWKGATYERGESQTFWNQFFEIFEVNRRKVATFEEPVKKLGGGQGFIDLFWKGQLLVEHKSFGKDLTKAKPKLTIIFQIYRNATCQNLCLFVIFYIGSFMI